MSDFYDHERNAGLDLRAESGILNLLLKETTSKAHFGNLQLQTASDRKKCEHSLQ